MFATGTRKMFVPFLLLLCIFTFYYPGADAACSDLNRHCRDWARKGECSKNPGYMKVYCKQSCGLCTGGGGGSGCYGCKDSSRNCKRWASIGECRRNPAYMRLYCRYSCRICTCRTKPTRAPVTRPPVTQPPPPKPTTDYPSPPIPKTGDFSPPPIPTEVHPSPPLPSTEKPTTPPMPPIPVTTGAPPVPGTTGVPPVPVTTGVPPVPGTTGVPPIPISTGVPPVPGTTGVPPIPISTGGPPIPGTTGAPPIPGTTGVPPIPDTTAAPPLPPTTGVPPIPESTTAVPPPPKAVNGSWNEWSKWSACTVACGGGSASRNRTCNNPPPANNGTKCVTKNNTKSLFEAERQQCNWKACSVCNKTLPVGIAVGSFPNEAFKASTSESRWHQPDQARLNLQPSDESVGAWCAGLQDKNQSIKIDLGETHNITSILTQGRESEIPKYVSSYNVDYSLDGTKWTSVPDERFPTKEKVFEGNSDTTSIKKAELKVFVLARHLRIRPKEWKNMICMRLEFEYCNTDSDTVL